MADNEEILGGMLDSGSSAASVAPASFDTGVVTTVVDAGHIKVNLGDKEVTVTVPANLANAAPADSFVRIQVQENSYVLDSVLSGAGMYMVPVGAMMDWGTATPPDGWLICNGQSFSATTYPVLAALYPTLTVPNIQDRVVIGASGTKAVKSTGGSNSITLSVAQLPAHAHAHPHDHKTGMAIGTIREGTSASTPQIMYPVAGGTDTGPESPTNTNNTGSGSAIDITPAYVALHKIIRAG